MPLFTYAGDDGRYYPSLVLTCFDGDVVELDEAPADGRFTDAPDGSTPTPPRVDETSPAEPPTGDEPPHPESE